jgi:hypothetical protein
MDDYVIGEALAILQFLSPEILRASPFLMYQVLDPELAALAEDPEMDLELMEQVLDEETDRRFASCFQLDDEEKERHFA